MNERQVAVVGLPDVAAVLRRAGFSVVGGGDFAQVANQIKEALEAAPKGTVPLIASGTRIPGMQAWLTRHSNHTTVVIAASGDERVNVPNGYVVELPAAIDDLVCEAGFDPLGPGIGDLGVDADGTVEGAPAPAPEAQAPDEDPWGDPVPEPEPAPAPAQQTQPQAEEDPWGDQPPAPAPPAPPEADTPWDEPAVPEVEPAPRQQPQPEEDPWGDQPEPPVKRPMAEEDPWDEPTAKHPESTPGAAPDPWGDQPSIQRPGQHQQAPRRPQSAPTPEPRQEEPWDEPPRQTEPAPRHRPEPAPEPEPEPAPPPSPERFVESVPEPYRPGSAIEPVTRHEPLDDIVDVYADDTADPSIPGHRHPLDRAPIVFSVAGKGGVGKTSMALTIAHRAATSGLDVVLVDLNRGQSDVTIYLRLRRAAVPTVWDARRGDASKAIISPRELAEVRHRQLQPIPFSVALGPPAAKADPNVVTADVYRRVIEHARSIADLVVVDTQIIEAHDTSGLIDEVVEPILNQDGWAVCVTGTSSASVDNNHVLLGRWRDMGIPVARMLMMMNKVDGSVPLDMDKMARGFGDRSTVIGKVEADAATSVAMNRGQILSDSPQVSEVIDEILWRATGDNRFHPSTRVAPTGGFLDTLKGFASRFPGRKR